MKSKIWTMDKLKKLKALCLHLLAKAGKFAQRVAKAAKNIWDVAINKVIALWKKLITKDKTKPQNEYAAAFTRGLVKENPALRLMLGVCPTLAVTTAAFNGLAMGLAATVVLVCSNVVVSLLRRIIPDKVRLPVFIIIIATFTTIVQLLVKAFLSAVDQALGIFLPLIVVNCIILGRAETYASKHTVGLSALDGLGMGAGFTGVLVIMGAIREFLGNGTLFGWPGNGMIPAIGVFVLPAGGFFVFGMMSWLVNKLVRHFEGEDAPVATSICNGCPRAATCNCIGEEACADE